MNSLHLDPEHDMLRTQVARFVNEKIKPHAHAWEDDGCTPRALLREMGALGFFGIRYPSEYGGSSMDVRASVVLAEELGRSTYSGVAITALVHTDMASVHLHHGGTPAQKSRFMRPIIAGECITAVAVTEPDAGSDVKGIRTRAQRDGDAYVLNGSKTFITNGVYADVLFVAARTEPDAPASQGLSIFLVERDTPGFEVTRQLDKTGWLSSDTAELSFEDCRIPAENLVGEINRGFYAIMRNFQNERLILGAMAIGEAQAAIETTISYVRDRQAFGATLWDKQAIRQRLSMLAARVEAGRRLVYGVAADVAAGRDCIREVSMVKAYCGELVNEVLYDCVQFHGGTGYMRGTAIERLSRDVRIQAIGGGATEVMLEEIAKRL